mgnify:FL=1
MMKNDAAKKDTEVLGTIAADVALDLLRQNPELPPELRALFDPSNPATFDLARLVAVTSGRFGALLGIVQTHRPDLDPEELRAWLRECAEVSR